ncbi:MAG TPA: ABC transporter ATP-binding protein [Gammaproteobacteria bacterium]|nr:ABC transporter ATP-binding protein [Gammaproteobacteria bacterium]
MNALLEARGLTVQIAGKDVCRDLSFALHAGECVGMLGANGVGKTTLLHTLAGLRAPASGEVLLDGVPIAGQPRRRIAQRLGLLMQQPEDSLPATVLETALIGRHPHLDFWRWESHADVAIARRALKHVGLDGLEQRAQTALSGGERRRLDVATVLVQDPQVFLLDEPAHQLDLQHQIGLLHLLKGLAGTQGRCILMSLHDINLAARFCDRVLLLFGEGEARFDVTDRVLTPENLSRLYHTPVTALPWGAGRVFVAGGTPG